MEIKFLPTLLPSLKNKHLLLDTNIIRDAVKNPIVFNNFFNDLKKEHVTLSTIDHVRYEILKGSLNESKYTEKEKFLNEIIDVTIPVLPETYKLAYELIKMYGINGSGVHITDLILGAILMQYEKNIYLITRDTSDFILSIFKLPFIVNATYNKGIYSYGIYQYIK
ncbi:MAG: hypothetical protein UV73_C0003G0195 [Candidatus Gottesmanbacteria bacterium GW2011_GWA2_43_14]|uniref:PIN domain-containing protein n=1 Tax=Candidatus Gottesmanbacteria bacterium GW2011_GWA2_43_14 TaxID=1618443 RepID=A0A0G1GHI6_9BACT|nr:MAG: hypothetical protein UV73_C0003G0195 [Candidatus Gottesmanbacteria bacterium GW2011_GWA2_43_14]